MRKVIVKGSWVIAAAVVSASALGHVTKTPRMAESDQPPRKPTIAVMAESDQPPRKPTIAVLAESDQPPRKPTIAVLAESDQPPRKPAIALNSALA
jgi:hypothetical protein